MSNEENNLLKFVKLTPVVDHPELDDDDMTEVVEWALGEFPPGVLDDHIDEAFDIIYEAIEMALERTRQ